METKDIEAAVKPEAPSGAPYPVREQEPNSPQQVSPSPSTRSKYADEDMVILLVGPDKERLHSHGHRLARTSQFFTTELMKEWSESQTRTISLPEEDIDTVTRYLDFVYAEGLPTVHTVTYDDLEAYKDAYLHLFELYTFGERMLDSEIQRAIIAETLWLSLLESSEGTRLLPENREISVIYRGTPENSPARRMLVDLHVSYGFADSLESNTCDPTYLGDVARAFNRCVQENEQTEDFRFCELSADDYLV